MPYSENDSQYINTTEYKKLETRLTQLVSVMDELSAQNTAARKLRYTEIDIESERASSKLQPDELLIPQHIIDANIRREQSSYIQYVTQSPRAVVMQDFQQPANDTSIIERDVTNKIRFDGWQLSMFANIDGFQQNGYGILEVVFDQSKPGNVGHEFVQLGDFGMVSDTKDIQDCEMVVRNYYFSKTMLIAMAEPNSPWKFEKAQVDKVVGKDPPLSNDNIGMSKDKSLYRIQKVMFRFQGLVHVGWACKESADDWLRVPQPLFIGRRELITDPLSGQPQMQGNVPASQDVYEKDYPYYVFPYLISENNTINQLKGRAYLDQDCQTAVTSLLSSFCTAHRRAAGLYFSKDVEDPNDDIMMQKNIFFRSGALINSKVTQFQLTPPSADIMSAINALVLGNQQETSQVNFAAQNRKDSRKTAEEIRASTQAANALSTVQVVLFSNALKNVYTAMFDIIQSRVVCGLLQVQPEVAPYYQRKYIVKPAGDTDVIERQQLLKMMMDSWPVMKETPAGPVFLMDMIARMFPEHSSKYIQIIQQAMQQQQSQQAQQQMQMMQGVKQLADGVVALSKKPEMFSEIGKIHALPALEQTAETIESMQEARKQQAQQKPQQ